MTQERSGGFVKQAGIEIPQGIVIEKQNMGTQTIVETVVERLREAPARIGKPNEFVGIESAEYANQLSPQALRKAKRQMGIRYMGQLR